jgi:putative autoinducer-2 (AI-2) aldolase
MNWGLANRMSKLFGPDGNCFYLAIDHGYFQGPTHGLENPARTLAPLTPYVDAIFVPRGTLRAAIDPCVRNSIILRVSGGNSMVGDDLANENVTVSIDEILRLNVSAVGYSTYIGSKYEHQTLLGLNNLVNMCAPYDIPVMAVTAVGREMDQKKETRFLALACRICAEAGAHVVKTYYTEDFEKVVEGCPVPVVIAGGPKTDNPLDVLKFVHDGIQRGARGVNLGRNIWQDSNPAGMARALQAVIHEKAAPEEAFELYQGLKV